MDGTVLFWTSLVCAGINGWISILLDCTLTVLSVKWFPADQRTTATGWWSLSFSNDPMVNTKGYYYYPDLNGSCLLGNMFFQVPKCLCP